MFSGVNEFKPLNIPKTKSSNLYFFNFDLCLRSISSTVKYIVMFDF